MGGIWGECAAGCEMLAWQSISLFPVTLYGAGTHAESLGFGFVYISNRRFGLLTEITSVLDFSAVCSFYILDFRRFSD